MQDRANDRIYHVSHNGERYGPFSRIELSARTLTNDMLVWREGMPEWLPISAFEEIRPYVKHAATTRTTVPPRGWGGPQRTVHPPPAPAPLPSPPPPRSTAATTLGILHIIIASLTLFCWPLAVLGNLASSSDGSPLADVLQRPEVRYGQVASLGIGFVLAVPMLIAGIGLVRRRNWARVLAVACAWCGIGLQAVHFFFMLVAAIMPMVGIASEIDDPSTWSGAFGLMVGNVLGTCGGVIYDVIALVIMGNATVRRSLN